MNFQLENVLRPKLDMDRDDQNLMIILLHLFTIVSKLILLFHKQANVLSLKTIRGLQLIMEFLIKLKSTATNLGLVYFHEKQKSIECQSQFQTQLLIMYLVP